MASIVYIRPNVDTEDLGLRYRDQCNRTGRCPGCQVDIQHWRDAAGMRHIHVPPRRWMSGAHQQRDARLRRAGTRRSTRRPQPALPVRVGRKSKQCCGRRT
jgi:hypothetical protein